MTLKVNNGDKARAVLQLSHSQDPALQFKAHPNVDKSLWANSSTIALRDQNKPFPVSQPLGVLKWKFTAKDESQVPLLVNCWPSPTDSGSCDCTIEYELQSPNLNLEKVTIIIPYSGNQPPIVGNVDQGQQHVDRNSKTILWNLASINSSNSSGTLEFSIDNDDVSTLFPIQIHFNSSKSYADIKVQINLF
jgi:hypothetical protein